MPVVFGRANRPVSLMVPGSERDTFNAAALRSPQCTLVLCSAARRPTYTQYRGIQPHFERSPSLRHVLRQTSSNRANSSTTETEAVHVKQFKQRTHHDLVFFTFLSIKKKDYNQSCIVAIWVLGFHIWYFYEKLQFSVTRQTLTAETSTLLHTFTKNLTLQSLLL